MRGDVKAHGEADALKKTIYRPEIDGLRAVAVGSVILFHAGVPFISAGFLGVDVFFVISGYLISGIIMTDLELGRFSIINFYERRVRRIIPALVVMTLLCIPLAYLTLLPGDLENFGQSVVATTLSANNILLLLTAGYFDLSTEFKPLIHTWSLGVEEQYYFLVPLLMFGAFKIGRRRGVWAGLMVIALVSFSYCLWATRHAPSANFYLIFSRAWELAAGAALALAEPRLRRDLRLGPALTSALALAGLVLVIAPMIFLGRITSMPNALTLMPVAGVCAILLFTGGSDVTTRLLCARPLVFVGVLSYSAYLYHQPLFAFVRNASLSESGAATMALLVLATLACAYLSWRFIEQPFRDRRRMTIRRMLMFCGGLSAIALGLGLAMHLGHGFPKRWSAEIRDDDGLNPAKNARYVDGPRRFTDRPFGPANDRPNTLILGDSFGRDFINMGLESGKLANHDLSYSEGTGCGEALSRDVLARAAQADFIVLSAAFENDTSACLLKLKAALAPHTKASFAIIGTKNFGLNNNAIMLLPADRRYSYRTRPLESTTAANHVAERLLPADIFVDVLAMIEDDEGRVPIFTPEGRFISQDTKHLTKAGARYIGDIIFNHPALQRMVLRQAKAPSSPISR